MLLCNGHIHVGVSWDADFSNYANALIAQSAALASGWDVHFNDFYLLTKSDGLTWGTSGNIRAMHMLAHGNFNANKVNMVTPAGTFASSTGSPTSGANGEILNGSTQFVDIGVAPNISTQNGLGFGCYVQAESETNSGRNLMGSQTSSSRISSLSYGISPDRTFAIPSTFAGGSMIYSGGHATGAILCNRTSSTSSVCAPGPRPSCAPSGRGCG